MKIYKLFEKVGVDNIKYITTYSANSISELTNDKVQEIIDNTDAKEVSSHMTDISSGGPAPIPVTHGSNSLDNSSNHSI